ncbi:CsgG/HfaB family protein [Myxococcaceae bacterium GXIMD 01537]
MKPTSPPDDAEMEERDAHDDPRAPPSLRAVRARADPAARASGPLLSARHALLIAAGLALPGLAALLLRPEPQAPPSTGTDRIEAAPPEAVVTAPARAPLPAGTVGATAPPSQAAGETAPPPPAATGPVRVCVLPFKNLGREEALAVLQDGLAESVVTDFGQHPGFRLIERGLLELDLQELAFTQTGHVDPATRAQLGRIIGAEVVVLGSYQRAGKQLRATARFVHVETGEVLEASRVEGLAGDPLSLQDSLAARVKELLPTLQRRLRP